MQVNHSPSFTTDSPLDREVKDALLYDTLVLINLGACDRRKITKEERRRVKDRLQQNRSREARYGPVRRKWCVNVFPRSYIHCVCFLETYSMQVTVTACACVLPPGRRSCVNARQPRWNRWRGTRPNTWEALRGSIPEREGRNTTSTSNTAARSSRRLQRPRPERSVPGTCSSHSTQSEQFSKEMKLLVMHRDLSLHELHEVV